MRRVAGLLSVAVMSAIACALASCASAAAGAPAARTSATLPARWRIVASFPAGSSVVEFTASGPDSAWAAESCRKPCEAADDVILLHWNGKAWQPEPQPAVAAHDSGAEPLLVSSPGSNVVWAVYDLYDQETRASVAEWTGRSWAPATVFPVGTNFQTLVAPAPSDVWAFGASAESGPSYVARYNGKSWSQAPSPGAAVGPWTAVASSASDIWAQSIAKQGTGLAVSHWNGARWVKQALPPAPEGDVGSAGGLSGDLVVSGQDNVWTYGYFEFGPASQTNWLVHFNGKAWSTVRNPYPLNQGIMTGPLAPDGNGGAWIAASPVKSTTEAVYHVTAAGNWQKLPLPAPKGASGTVIAGFAAIPGSTSVYAYGRAMTRDGQPEGVILKYGP